jgi:hypothetical protein
MFEIILLTYLAYRNSVLAKRKEQNQVAWAVYTVVAYLVCMMLGIVIVLAYFCKDIISIDQLSKLAPTARAQQLQQVFVEHPLHMLTIELFGIGGYLLVRYLLERKPGKKEPEVHWMDKMGGEQ